MATFGKGLLRALATFSAKADGVEYIVREGEFLPAGHPIVKGRENLFAPAFPVEQATAAPGQKRRR